MINNLIVDQNNIINQKSIKLLTFIIINKNQLLSIKKIDENLILLINLNNF
jgi:hypothetical protein